jgi:hypothetical protein
VTCPVHSPGFDHLNAVVSELHIMAPPPLNLVCVCVCVCKEQIFQLNNFYQDYYIIDIVHLLD